MAKERVWKASGTFLAILHKAIGNNALMCSALQVTHTGRASLRSSLREATPSLAGPATGQMNLEMLRDVVQQEVELNTMSRIHILYLQALREAKQNTLTNFGSKTSVTRCLFKTVEAQTGLQSGAPLASLWDFNRKDVAAVSRHVHLALRLRPARRPAAPRQPSGWRHFSGASLRGLLNRVAARGPGHRK